MRSKPASTPRTSAGRWVTKGLVVSLGGEEVVVFMPPNLPDPGPPASRPQSGDPDGEGEMGDRFAGLGGGARCFPTRSLRFEAQYRLRRWRPWRDLRAATE